MRKNLTFGRQLFAKQVPILLQGATGTGKEAFAKALHHSGLWYDKPFVTVNCAAIPESLIESELFGYTRGAFTGAVKEGRVGKILQSNGGTLFLDEIGDMPLMLQTRLLRVIEEREVVPLGSDQAIPVTLHVISATHRDIRQMIRGRRISRGSVLPLERHHAASAAAARPRRQGGLDPHAVAGGKLRPGIDRDRRGCFPEAAGLFLARQHPSAAQRFAHRLGAVPRRNHPAVEPASGNSAHRDAARVPASAAGHVDAAAATAVNLPSAALRDAECAALLRELERMHWNISRTAQALGISRNTLYRKIHKHNIVLEQ